MEFCIDIFFSSFFISFHLLQFRFPSSSLSICRRRQDVLNHGSKATSRHVGAAVARTATNGVCNLAASRGRMSRSYYAIGPIYISRHRIFISSELLPQQTQPKTQQRWVSLVYLRCALLILACSSISWYFAFAFSDAVGILTLLK